MPVRFCPQCGTKAVPEGKFCAQCGTALDTGAAPAAATHWQLTTVGAGVLACFLVAGLSIWTLILRPSPPRPGPGGGRPAATPAAPEDELPPGHPKTVELPEQVQTFIADLAAKAKTQPKDVDTWLRLAQVNARAAQLDPSYQPSALSAFEHVLELDPKNADALRGAANVHYDRNDHRQAIPVYERYLALRPDDPSARTDLATMYLYAGNAERAIATYRDVIKQTPSFLQAHYNLAITYHQQGKDAEALAELGTARGLATEDSVRRQIDEMIASLGGAVPPAAGAGAPAVAGAGAPAAAPAATRTDFQRSVEEALRAHPIMGQRIAGFEWTGAGAGRVLVRNFPMENMPPEVREKFLGRLGQQLRTAGDTHPAGGPVRLEIADASSGTVMATVTP